MTKPSPRDISIAIRHMIAEIDESHSIREIAGEPMDKRLARRLLDYLSANLDDITEALHD